MAMGTKLTSFVHNKNVLKVVFDFSPFWLANENFFWKTRHKGLQNNRGPLLSMLCLAFIAISCEQSYILILIYLENEILENIDN